MLEHLTQHFHEAGYASASFGKRHYCAANNAFQIENHFELSEAVTYYAYADAFDPANYGVVHYPAAPYPWIFGGRFPLGPEHTSEARAIREATAWLETRDESAPFFLRVSFNAPHTPVVPPAPYDTLIDPDAIALPPDTEEALPGQPEWIADTLRTASDARRLTPEQIRDMRRYYYGEVAFLDSQVGQLLDWMRGRGLLDNTIVVFLSDHGTHLGDYGLVQKQTFYDPVVQVPYIFWYPENVPAGVSVETPVETRSLLPTLLSLTGLPVPEDLRGGGLGAALRSGAEPPSSPVFSEFTLGSFKMRPDDRLVMVRDGRWKLSLCFPAEPGPSLHPTDGALFNLHADPHELTNLYGHPQHPAIQNRLTSLIKDHLARTHHEDEET